MYPARDILGLTREATMLDDFVDLSTMVSSVYSSLARTEGLVVYMVESACCPDCVFKLTHHYFDPSYVVRVDHGCVYFGFADLDVPTCRIHVCVSVYC